MGRQKKHQAPCFFSARIYRISSPVKSSSVAAGCTSKMEHLEPASAREVAEILQRGRRTIVAGAGTKSRMGGPVDPGAETTLLTTGLNSLIRYEPRDLTVSVGAGMRFMELSRLLAENRQMVPLDPPFA